MQNTFRAVLFLPVLLLAACVSPLQRDLNTILQPPELQGVRWGLLVTDMQGIEVVAVNPDQRFLPASNAKLFTTAAVFRWQDDLALMAPGLATHVTLEDADEAASPNLVLYGRGDPALNDTPDCETRCLSHLADAVAATGLIHINAVIGDDTWFPDDRWPYGWSWEDLQSDDGTAISALTINDNVLRLTVTPAPTQGAPADVTWANGDGAYAILNETVTVEAEADDFAIARPPGADIVRISGHVPPNSGARSYRLGVEDPAEFAAQRFSALLAARGITVDAPATSRHRTPGAAGAEASAVTALEADGAPVAAMDPLSFHDALVAVSKDSQNLYAELLLRHLGQLSEDGAAKAGLARVNSLLDEAGANPNGHDLFDGSGMSVYNRVSPRTIVTLLYYAAAQDWGDDWRGTFPVGGTDGSLLRRFRGTILEGRIFAKTGTLKGTNALSGYMTAASGQTLIFSILANERPLSVPSATPFMDAALVRIAERN
jgi:D-alanyl-D-alanine carboxypeptidase/D-alanyl-D-alanine-endopeptidase (penicillin-binding protein 4)